MIKQRLSTLLGLAIVGFVFGMLLAAPNAWANNTWYLVTGESTVSIGKYLCTYRHSSINIQRTILHDGVCPGTINM